MDDLYSGPNTSSTLHYGSISASSKALSAQDWETKKHIIRSLYITRDLSLDEVVARMRRDHGFKATSRMYKSRLKGWGFSKNVGDKDWQAAAIMRQKREEEQKETVAFKIHGRTKTGRELDQHIARRCTSAQEFVAKALADGVTASASIRCVSPVHTETGDHGVAASASMRCVSPAHAETGDPRPASGSSAGQPSSSLSYAIGAAPRWTPSSGSTGSQPQRHYPQPHVGYVEMPPMNYPKLTSVPSIPVLAAAMPNLMQESSSAQSEDRIDGAIEHDGNSTECDYMQQELGVITAITYRPDAVRAAFPELRDSDGWELVSMPEATTEPKICPKCQQPCRGHSPLPRTVLQRFPSEFGQLLHYQPLPPEETPLPGSDKASRYQALCYAACMYGSQEKFDILARALREGDDTFKEMILENNPMALLSVLLALTVLHAHNRGTMAESIIRSAYNVIWKILGEYNPLSMTVEWLTAAAGQKLSNCRITTLRLREAKLAMEQTFELEHPHVIVVTYCLAFQLIRDRAFGEAENILTQLADTCQRRLGKSNLQTVSTLNALGRAQKNQKRYDEASETLKRALKLEPLGPNHVYQLDSLKDLARLYKIQGRQDLMEPIYWRVLAGRIKTLGKTHSFTEAAKLDLMRCLMDRGRWDDEGIMEEKVQKLFDERPLMSDHEAF